LSSSISTGVTTNNTPANTNYTLNFVSPTVAGAYTIQVYATTGSGGGTIRSAVLSWPVTVTAIDTKADATSTSFIARGVSVTGTEDSVTAFTRSLTAGAAVQAATIKVTQKSAITTAVPNESMTVTISGPGSLSSGATTTGSASGARAITVKNGDYIHVFNDGASGVATITATGATSGVVLGTEKVTFFGAATTLTTTVVTSVIGGTTAVAGVLLVTAKDSAGVDVTNLSSLGVVSATTAAIATNYSSTATWSDAKGGYLVSVTPVAAGSSALTVTTNASATDTTGISAAAASVRVGSATPASITVAMDKTSYAPGEAVKATITVLDDKGLTVADGVYNNIFAATGISANYTIGSWSDTTTVTVASGVGTRTGYLPTTEGDVVFKWTTGTNLATANQAVAGTATVSVSSPSTAAATDAANEATDAANAATDAALAAAEAADAATTAAQEASDAVAALSESVTKLIAGLQAQIKSLAAVVAKIAKKVKA
jgi:hypothetical protein